MKVLVTVPDPKVPLYEITSAILMGLDGYNIHGILEEGVAAATRQDGQAKSLGEWLRARYVDIPEALLP